ncbi:MAG: RdgB/HAM1 family non-canonical purine NTP pyrophosphatase [Clostridiales bacterium]|jgi:XTP/dITP diphosphohydrolase|nr:RdgB/HAM1 family non-canonical purine NTP pyrophosphatase [Clostridiales bacterium]
MDIIAATKNKDKLREMREILGSMGFRVIAAAELGVTEEITEDGATFEDNAIKKARVISQRTGAMALADDSGIEIDYLGKKPGVRSSRFLGEKTDYAVKNKKILDIMRDAEENERTARYVCVMAAASPRGEILLSRGEIEGVISREPRGTGGFGYDPIFLLPEKGATFGEMADEEKNRISHRRKALDGMAGKLVSRK